jgi:hypothetical protein
MGEFDKYRLHARFRDVTARHTGTTVATIGVRPKRSFLGVRYSNRRSAFGNDHSWIHAAIAVPSRTIQQIADKSRPFR